MPLNFSAGSAQKQNAPEQACDGSSVPTVSGRTQGEVVSSLDHTLIFGLRRESIVAIACRVVCWGGTRATTARASAATGMV
jgi:hypothetical protein